MTKEDYEKFVKSNYFTPATREYAAIALGGEVGEVLNEVKKEIRLGNGGGRMYNVCDELGDVLYYLVMLADVYGVDLEYIMQGNKLKLEERRRISRSQ